MRRINLPPILVKSFKEIKQIEIDGNLPVFYSKRKSILSQKMILRSFKDAFRELNLPWSGTHIARHTSGTLALIAGKDLTIVQAMLGHSDVAQTQAYAKVIALQDNSAPHKTAELLGLE